MSRRNVLRNTIQYAIRNTQYKLRFENEKLEFNILEEIWNLFYVCLFKANSVFNLKNKQFKDDVVNSDDSVDIETLNISSLANLV